MYGAYQDYTAPGDPSNWSCTPSCSAHRPSISKGGLQPDRAAATISLEGWPLIRPVALLPAVSLGNSKGDMRAVTVSRHTRHVMDLEPTATTWQAKATAFTTGLTLLHRGNRAHFAAIKTTPTHQYIMESIGFEQLKQNGEKNRTDEIIGHWLCGIVTKVLCSGQNPNDSYQAYLGRKWKAPVMFLKFAHCEPRLLTIYDSLTITLLCCECPWV